ncbi:hypothetical protein M406DRAFT_105473 [Cryphonectria parasitica EP155]|uniref:Uncharacterized protein n=1 Tax=Cryphonectria parasitica (strain ATCC 38755 / EP155) TaxID=660469 RepID=A0A9P5CTJ0_CRYP1|nr:uncharacterized protein M406DRAFT_105473 [Cryphonectria parasitica EP155]KAF3770689.1 hypothetical protein M406DRAFT_105473 [Cryphonectria parasitica EP155]
MGVPKFFRWLSERYPAISQLIAENRIPEFDALYLDMNGIIHNCTHKDSDDTQFRLSEEEMFIRIFNYIEHLFGKIKPKQLFFMAVDGVAPRAKMNQQRARRFRTALDAEQAREKAIREGQELPKEEPFDSNCITPGTEFMAKLSRQLRYFINKKVTEDKEWQGCEIVLSGHEVPGEGEHKIMEYIRNARAQPNYHPNMRHCLYGLDADLIMLGLLSHDPHFCLLREEVTFGRQSKVQSKELEHQNFYLMHLCIVREYLELEFQDLKETGATALGFPTYKKVLPKCDGYINEGGVMNLKRLGFLLEELSKEEYRFFEHEAEDQKWFRAKRSAENGKAAPKPKGKLIVTSAQKTLWKQSIKPFLTKRSTQTLDLGASLNAADRKFVQDLADSANLSWSTDSDDDGARHLVLSFPPKPEMDGEEEGEEEAEEEEEDESQLAINRLVKKYDNAEVQDVSAEEAQAQYENIFDLPPIEGLSNRQGLMDGALLNVSALAGFPSLATLPYNATLGFHGVNVFQSDSRNESMVVTLVDSTTRTNVENAKAKLGKRCFVGYPFLQEAKIVRVSDELFDYILAEDGSGQVVLKDHSNKDIDDYNKNARYWEDFYSKRLGILIGDVESMVHVEMLKGLIKTDEGATIKEYGLIPGMRDFYASQTIVDEVVNEDERFLERAALPLEEEFPVNTRAFHLGDFNYGRPLAVTGYNGAKLEVTISAMNNKEPEFAKQVVFKHERENRYVPSFQVSRDLGLHPLAFSKITSSYQVIGVGGLKVNLGLNLKFESRKMKVLGFSRKSDSGWEYSRKAIQLVAEYMQKFPDFFAGLQKNVQKRDVAATDLWADEKTATARVKEMAQYLKSVGTNNFPKVPLEAEQLDSNVVMELAQAAEGALAAAQETTPKNIKSVPRSALLKPSDAEHRLGGQGFRLGDRVVYVQDIGKVPIASRGTVVGISRAGSNKILDVLFDITFMSGNTLDGRCPAFRGQTVPATSVLNLTDRQVVVGSKAQMARAPHPSLTTLVASGGYGAPGASGRAYHDAPIPPPLSGSWRGALNGQRGRGGHDGAQRGSLNIQPSNLVYRHSPNQTPQQGYRGGRGGYQNGHRGGRGNGAPRGRGGMDGAVMTNGQSQQNGAPAQSYNAVPPPAGLDGRGRGRGRGRGGPRGRGRGGPAQQSAA